MALRPALDVQAPCTQLHAALQAGHAPLASRALLEEAAAHAVHDLQTGQTTRQFVRPAAAQPRTQTGSPRRSPARQSVPSSKSAGRRSTRRSLRGFGGLFCHRTLKEMQPGLCRRLKGLKLGTVASKRTIPSSSGAPSAPYSCLTSTLPAAPCAESKQPPSQSCSLPTTSVPPDGIFLPRPRTADHTCARWGQPRPISKASGGARIHSQGLQQRAGGGGLPAGAAPSCFSTAQHSTAQHSTAQPMLHSRLLGDGTVTEHSTHLASVVIQLDHAVHGPPCRRNVVPAPWTHARSKP